MNLQFSLKKAQAMYKKLNETCEDEPICVICNYRCPYSPYEEGQYCEREEPESSWCWQSFLNWLKERGK